MNAASMSSGNAGPRSNDVRPILRIAQSALQVGEYGIDLVLTQHGCAPIRVRTGVSEPFSALDREDLRWYFEERTLARGFLDDRCRRIEAMLDEVGARLGAEILSGTPECTGLWRRIRDDVGNLRIEIDARIAAATMFPWELLANPETGLPLALEAGEFVRVVGTEIPSSGRTIGMPLRVLLVISRPRGLQDVPLRTVSHTLVQWFGRGCDAPVEVTVLRPPTFEQLLTVLQIARRDDHPFEVVHFDGHGVLGRDKGIGLWFERMPELEEDDPYGSDAASSASRADGEGVEPELGKIITVDELVPSLVEAGVRHLTLNACRSAFSLQGKEQADGDEASTTGTAPDALSFAERAVQLGLHGVVAMRYNVYAASAAHFIAELYRGLADGVGLAEGVAYGRRLLRDVAGADPLETISHGDWYVPIVVEANLPEVRIRVAAASRYFEPVQRAVDRKQRPPAFGRDQEIYMIDRLFDHVPVVLLHGLLGAGKSAIAREFAWWYHASGGIPGEAAMTSAAGCAGLDEWLNHLGASLPGYEPPPEDPLVDYRLPHLLDHLRAAPVLIVIDDVEHVTGAAGLHSRWDSFDQVQFDNLLQDIASTQARILLISCGLDYVLDPLGRIPRIPIPPLSPEDARLAGRAIARRINAPPDIHNIPWHELDWSFSHAATLEWAVRWFAAHGLRPMKLHRINAPVTISGNRCFPVSDCECQIAERIMQIVETYLGIEAEIVALLHLFLNHLDVDMVAAIAEHVGLPFAEQAGADRSQYARLFQEFADADLARPYPNVPGLHDRPDLDLTNYEIPPLVTLFMEPVFDNYFRPGSEIRSRVLATYTALFAMQTRSASRVYDDGSRDVITALMINEPNLHRALAFAIDNDWLPPVMDLMEGVRVLCRHWPWKEEWYMVLGRIWPMVASRDGHDPERERAWATVQRWSGERSNHLGHSYEAMEAFTAGIDTLRVCIQRGEYGNDDDGRARRREDLRELALTLLCRGELLLTQSQLVPLHNSVPRLLGSTVSCVDDLVNAEQLSIQIADDALLVRTLLLLARYYSGMAVSEAKDPNTAVRYCNDATSVVERGAVRDVLLIAEVRLLRSQFAYHRYLDLNRNGNTTEAREAWARFIREVGLSNMGIGDAPDLRTLNQHTLKLNAELHNQLAIAHAHTRKAREARQLWEMAAGEAEAAGLGGFASTMMVNIAQMLRGADDTAGAAEYQRAADRLLQQAERGER